MDQQPQRDTASDDTLGTAFDDEPVASDHIGGYFLESLVSARDALELLKLHLVDSGDGVPAIRRVAHSLTASAAMFGFPRIVEAANDVQRSPDSELAERVSVLIDVLGAVVEEEPSHTVQVLVAESDPDLADLLYFTLSTPNRTVRIARSAAEAEQILGKEPVSLIVLDLDLANDQGAGHVDVGGDGAPARGMPAGQDVLLRLRSRTRTAFIPTIVLSNADTAALKMECLALGADAFFAKPFDPAELSSMVAVRLQRRAFIDSKDPLTGLPDRVAFEETFERVRAAGASAEQPLSLALIDFDDFGQINELFGHAAGDRVLRRSADLIARSLRSSDVLARWQGQEFVALLPNATAEDADEILFRAQQSVRHERFTLPSGTDFRASFSAGISEVRPEDRLGDVLVRVRQFVEESKLIGPGRIHRPEHGIDQPQQTVLVVEDDRLVARLLRQRLEREGYAVIHCSSGSEGWKVAQEQTADLVLLDVRLPGVNGFELLQRLRTMPTYARCPIIMLTGMGSEGDIEQGFALGADDYLIKPFSPVELMARVHYRLGSQTRRRTGAGDGRPAPSEVRDDAG